MNELEMLLKVFFIPRNLREILSVASHVALNDTGGLSGRLLERPVRASEI